MFWLELLARGRACGVAIGGLNGLLIATTSMQPFIVTLATWLIWGGVAFAVMPIEGGDAFVRSSWTACSASIAAIPKSVCAGRAAVPASGSGCAGRASSSTSRRSEATRRGRGCSGVPIVPTEDPGLRGLGRLRGARGHLADRDERARLANLGEPVHPLVGRGGGARWHEHLRWQGLGRERDSSVRSPSS